MKGDSYGQKAGLETDSVLFGVSAATLVLPHMGTVAWLVVLALFLARCADFPGPALGLMEGDRWPATLRSFADDIPTALIQSGVSTESNRRRERSTSLSNTYSVPDESVVLFCSLLFCLHKIVLFPSERKPANDATLSRSCP
jgi:hypothetical protein